MAQEQKIKFDWLPKEEGLTQEVQERYHGNIIAILSEIQKRLISQTEDSIAQNELSKLFEKLKAGKLIYSMIQICKTNPKMAAYIMDTPFLRNKLPESEYNTNSPSILSRIGGAILAFFKPLIALLTGLIITPQMKSLMMGLFGMGFFLLIGLMGANLSFTAETAYKFLTFGVKDIPFRGGDPIANPGVAFAAVFFYISALGTAIVILSMVSSTTAWIKRLITGTPEEKAAIHANAKTIAKAIFFHTIGLPYTLLASMYWGWKLGHERVMEHFSNLATAADSRLIDWFSPQYNLPTETVAQIAELRTEKEEAPKIIGIELTKALHTTSAATTPVPLAEQSLATNPSHFLHHPQADRGTGDNFDARTPLLADDASAINNGYSTS